MKRKSTSFDIGCKRIGGDSPILVQSMLKTETANVKKAYRELRRLEEEGCDMVRIAVSDFEAAEGLKILKKKSRIPVIADIHFDPRLAIEAIESGADKIRLNPSNIKDREWIRKIAKMAKERGVAIRVGANLGSFRQRPADITKALVYAVMNEVEILEELGIEKIVVSAKTSDVLKTIEANQELALRTNYPIHVGITEAGPLEESLIRSSIGIGSLLLKGIGDTIRFSITGDSLQEARAAIELLRSLHLRQGGVEIVSCPTCGRTEIDIERIVRKVKRDFRNVKTPVKVAIMGCVVNGPGEAADADLGLAGGKAKGAIFKNGNVVKVVSEQELYTEFRKMLLATIEEKSKLS